MNRDQSPLHAKQVDAWMEGVLSGLPEEQQLRTFERAFQALQKRILQTLSEVTLMAVLDRALHEGKQKFPLLSGLKIDASEISLDELLSTQKNLNAGNVIDALRFFLIEVLTILENLTAGILNKPLYKELSQITAAIPSKSRNHLEEA